MKEKEMLVIGNIIAKVIQGLRISKKSLGIKFDQEKKISTRKQIINKTKEIKKLKKEVLFLCKKFPIKKTY